MESQLNLEDRVIYSLIRENELKQLSLNHKHSLNKRTENSSLSGIFVPGFQ